MEIKCKKEDLFSGVQAVERIVSTRSTLPIIGNILFETTKDGMKLSANNLEMGLEVNVSANIKQEGSVLLPAKTLAGIVSKLPSSDINMRKNDKGIVKISYKQSNFNINGLSPEEFPVLPKLKDTKNISISPKIFTEMAKQTIFAVSSSEDKYVLNGILLEIGKGAKDDDSNIRMVATDGFRLAKRGEKISGVNFDASVIVPAKALLEVVKMVQGAQEQGELKISVSNEQIAFRFNESYLVSRLIQGQFPDYKQVIPKSSEVKISVDTAAFLESAERAAVIAGGSSNIVKLKIEDGKVHIFASTPDVGSIDEVVEVEIEGKAKDPIAFNVRLLTDVLKAIESEKVVFEFSGPLSPGVIKPGDGSNYLYIIMPIRTTETSS